jgi:hypothetical protein
MIAYKTEYSVRKGLYCTGVIICLRGEKERGRRGEEKRATEKKKCGESE